MPDATRPQGHPLAAAIVGFTCAAYAWLWYAPETAPPRVAGNARAPRATVPRGAATRTSSVRPLSPQHAAPSLAQRTPPSAPARLGPPPDPRRVSLLTLERTLVLPSSAGPCVAIINDRLVREGERVEGILVQAILPDRVLLGDDGKTELTPSTPPSRANR